MSNCDKHKGDPFLSLFKSMKRKEAIVDYGSSGESDAESSRTATTSPHPAKKLKPLPVDLVVQAPRDDPALHQGRQRTRPHVEGQFATHIYIYIRLRGRLRSLFNEVVEYAKTSIPALHSLLEDGEPPHMSLSRTIYLRAHQREGFKLAIKVACRQHTLFQASFARLACLENDEKTRTFLTLEIGAGHLELKALSDAFTPHVRALYQEPYYEAPRFHISIAWALLRRAEPIDDEMAATSGVGEQADFPVIVRFPEEVLKELDDRFGTGIREVGQFDVDRVEVKIGKDVTRCLFR